MGICGDGEGELGWWLGGLWWLGVCICVEVLSGEELFWFVRGDIGFRWVDIFLSSLIIYLESGKWVLNKILENEGEWKCDLLVWLVF